MSTLNMLTEQSPFGRPNPVGTDGVSAPGPSPFTATAFSGDFLGMSIPDEENLWGLSPMSPSLPTWSAKDQTFANPHLERDMKNAQVRNGQPTPPMYEDKKLSPDLYTLAQCQLDGSPPMQFDHSQHRGYDFGTDINVSGKRRRTSKNSSGDSDELYHERAKREKFLERNRLAASKCRQKKKEHTMLLESRYKEQSDKKERLLAEIARLRSEILGLKNEVLKHAQCGDEPIKLHLAQMVKKITYNDNGPEITDSGDCASSSEAATTPVAAPVPPSFGFDDQLPVEPQARRDSESSLMTDGSYGYSGDDNFDDLINV